MKIFKFRQNIFLLFRNYLTFKRVRPSSWINLNPLHQNMLCAKLWWNLLSGSGEFFWISPMYFRYFVITSPWKRVGLFIWTNLNTLHPCMLGVVWLKSGLCFWRRFLKINNALSAFRNYLPMKKGRALYVKKTPWIPVTQGCFVPSLVEIDSLFLEKMILNFVNIFLLFRYYNDLKGVALLLN